jgi:hypothetical protein
VQNDQDRPDRATFSEAAPDPIAVTIGEFRACLDAAGPRPEGDDRLGWHWQVFRKYAAERGWLRRRDPLIWEGSKGGSEHQARYLADVGRWEKTTRPDFAGWRIERSGQTFVAIAASPLDYLYRLLFVNAVFGDDIAVVGVEEGDGLRIVTTQRHVDGVAPTEEIMNRWLARAGFTSMGKLNVGAYDSTAWRADSLWLFDVRPMNFVWANPSESDENSVVPIDVIVQLSDGGDEFQPVDS